MEPFPGDKIREGETGVCAEQLGKMAAGESQCHLDKDYTKNSVYRNMYPVLFL